MSKLSLEETGKPVGEIKFFGEVDLNKKGMKASEYPAWYFDRLIEDMEKEVSRKERALKAGQIRSDMVEKIRGEVEREKQRLYDIVNSKPKLTDFQKDKIAKEYDNLSNEIKESMFTRSEMMLGLASPHEEARRMSRPCIKINPEIAKSLGMSTHNGMVSRNNAERAYKIIGKRLEANTNPEMLRRDKKTVRTGR